MRFPPERSKSKHEETFMAMAGLTVAITGFLAVTGLEAIRIFLGRLSVFQIVDAEIQTEKGRGSNLNAQAFCYAKLPDFFTGWAFRVFG